MSTAFRGLLLACLLLVPSVARADDLKVQARLDRAVVALGQPVRLQVDVSGAESPVEPEMPMLADFLVQEAGRAQSTTNLFGVKSSSASITYVLLPRKPGQFTIAPIRVQSGGRTASSQPLRLEVTKGQAPAMPPPAQLPHGPGSLPAPTVRVQPRAVPAPPGTSGRGPAFLTAEVDNPRPYVGQGVTYTLRFYHVAGVTLSGAPQFPNTTGFVKEDLPPERTYSTVIDGTPYIVNEVRIALFPTAEGTHEVGATRLTCRMPFAGVPRFPGGGLPGLDDDPDLMMGPLTEQTLETRPVSLDVRPLPTEGRPDDFTGAVGHYKLASRLDPAHGAKVGQPLNLELTLSGEGNVNLIQAPHLPAMAGFKVYDPVASSSTDHKDYKVTGTRKFTIVLVPTKAGVLDIPPLSVSTFDPSTSRWQTLTTKPQQIAVAPGDSPTAGASGASPEPREGGLRPLHATLEGGTRHRLVESRAFLLLQVVPALILAGAFLAWGPRLRLFHRAPRAGSALRQAQARLRQAGGQAALAELPPVLFDYLSARLGTPTAGLRTPELVERLRQRGVPETDTARLEELLATAERARYCPVQPEVGEARAALQSAESLLERLERSLR